MAPTGFRYLVACPIAWIALQSAPVAAQVLPAPDDPRWGCYDAAPGHPTGEERRAFLSDVAAPARRIEAGGGPPAAGIMAMAAVESGFGWTRTALYARNLFGWKYTTAAAAGGRGRWSLDCQPASDPGKDYVVFADRADSIGFVAGRLRAAPRYAPVTRRFHADRTGGMSSDAAVERWVRGIAAAGYNPYPDYSAKVLAVVRGYRLADAAPGAGVAPDHAPGANTAESAAAAYLLPRLDKARYMAGNCGQPIRDWPGYAARDVRRCTYSVTSAGRTLSAIVYLLNPDAANIAARIGHACAAVDLGERGGCGSRLAQMILAQNGGQFPVAGFVVERKRDAGGQGDAPVYLEFRDGVTVVTADRLNFTDAQLGDAAMEHAARAPLVRAQRYARIANADRAAYRRAGGRIDVGTTPATDTAVRWPGVVRDNELAAQATGVDRLLIGVAMGMKAELARQP